MTLIAGIFNREGHALADTVCRELAQSVSRYPDDVIETIRKPDAFFAKLNIGAFNSKGLIEGGDAISLLTGNLCWKGRAPIVMTISESCMRTCGSVTSID